MDKENKIFNSTTIFAGLSAYIYFVWFEFENGICTHYQIPTYFISPSITGLLIFATTILSVITASFKILGISTPLFKQMKDPTKDHLHGIYFINGLMIVVGILVITTFPFSWRLFLGIVCGILFLNIFTWGYLYLFKIRKKGSFKEKITETLVEVREDNFDLFNLLDIKLNRSQFILIVLLAVLPFITYLLGMGTAASQKSYQIIDNKSNTVILKRYDDLFICRNLDSIKGFFSDTLKILRFNDNVEYQLSEYKGMIKMK